MDSNLHWSSRSVGVGGAAGSAVQFGVVKFRIPYIDMEYFVELYIDLVDFCDESELCSIKN